MAYVGTPSKFGSDLQTLASIIQGEAAGEGILGMQAVADVIRNRADKNFSGYGSGLLDQALARNQFQGQSTKVSPEALAVAQQLQGGTLPNVVGNAVYYANPGASTATWAKRLNSDNAFKVGNHYFTDNADGVPFNATAPNPVGIDGPKGQEVYTPPAGILGGPAPQQGGILAGTTGSPVPVGVAEYAASSDEKKSPLQNLFGALAKIEAPRPPNPGSMGDARQSGGLLLKALNDPTLSDLFLKKRLG